ncbi:MAG: ABC transporter substrate-binding protein [Actinomycetota bacterium]
MRRSTRRLNLHPKLVVAVAACALVAAACGTRVTDSGTMAAGTNGLGAARTGRASIDGATGANDQSAQAAGADTGTGAGSGAGAGGADTGGGEAGGGSSGVSGQGVTDTEILIGASGPLSGVTGFLGEEAFGAIDAYFQLVNSQGGINGRRLRLIALDDRFDSSQTLANVRKLWEEERVHALFLTFGDPVADYATRNKIPTLVFGVTPGSFSSRYPTIFPLVGNALLWTQEIIVGLKDQGVFRQGMRVGIQYDTQILDVSPYVPFLKESWEAAGAEVVSTDPFNLSDGDCTSLVLKMRQANIDWWDFQGLGWVLCASAASRQEYRPNIGWGGWPTSVAGLASQVGPWVDGIWGGAQGDQPNGKPRQMTPAHQEYADAINRYHPNIGSFNHLESPATIGYWSGARLLVEALRAQGDVITPEGTSSWIAGIENFDTGITPPIISMAPDCKTGSEVVWIGQWRWDAQQRQAVREPATGYFTSDQKERYGGKCFLTKISDDLG